MLNFDLRKKMMKMIKMLTWFMNFFIFSKKKYFLKVKLLIKLLFQHFFNRKRT